MGGANMATNVVSHKLDDGSVIEVLEKVRAELNGTEGEVSFDFSGVRRIDAGALRAMEQLASLARDKSVKIALRGVNVDIYKVLKVAKLASRFSFPT
jgi:anti-anti-sigma regulatory factor